MEAMMMVEKAPTFSSWGIIALVLAIAGGICTYVLFLNSKQDMKLSPFLKWLKDFLNFDKMLIEVILKVVYLIITIFVILLSFGFIAKDFGAFFLTLIFGPIIIRIIYELILIQICIWKNTTSINQKLKDKSKEK